jgi:hypothetical protein
VTIEHDDLPFVYGDHNDGQSPNSQAIKGGSPRYFLPPRVSEKHTHVSCAVQRDNIINIEKARRLASAGDLALARCLRQQLNHRVKDAIPGRVRQDSPQANEGHLAFKERQYAREIDLIHFLLVVAGYVGGLVG